MSRWTKTLKLIDQQWRRIQWMRSNRRTQSLIVPWITITFTWFLSIIQFLTLRSMNILDTDHFISFIDQRDHQSLTGIQWQLNVNFEINSHVPARHGFGSHGFVQFCKWISFQRKQNNESSMKISSMLNTWEMGDSSDWRGKQDHHQHQINSYEEIFPTKIPIDFIRWWMRKISYRIIRCRADEKQLTRIDEQNNWMKNNSRQRQRWETMLIHLLINGSVRDLFLFVHH